MPIQLAAVIGAAALLAAPTDAAPAPETIQLVSNGRPEAVIVVPEEPNPGERRAAEELQTYVEKGSGARLPIRSDTDAVAGARIVLGRACQGLNPPDGDGFAIETRGDCVQIAGAGARGTLYGAYGFLEEELGVRWFMPGEMGEVVPRSRSIRVAPIERRQQPSFEYRWIGPGDAWSARNRNNVGRVEIEFPQTFPQ